MATADAMVRTADQVRRAEAEAGANRRRDAASRLLGPLERLASS